MTTYVFSRFPADALVMLSPRRPSVGSSSSRLSSVGTSCRRSSRASAGSPTSGSIAVINLFLGWTLVGWVVALAMSFKDVPARDAPVTASTNAGSIGSAEAAALDTEGSAYRNCPNCGRSMDRGATACPDCGAASNPWLRHAGVWWTQGGKEGAWQWLDEKAKIWRWYADGTPSSPGATDLTPSREIDPALVSPPGTSSQTLAQETDERPTALQSLAPSAELERLGDLHARGILTDDEFQQAKRRVLDS